LRLGVYVGMFEQSMLVDFTPGKKAGALAISLTVQTIAAGTLLLIPLIYTERLPFIPLMLPVFLSPPPPSPDLPKAEPIRREVVAAGRRIFVPTRVPRLDTRPDVTVVAGDAPQIEPGFGPLNPGASAVSLLGTFLSIPPPPPVVVVDTAPPKPIVVTSDIQAAKLVRKVVPVYPRLAIAARVSGTVRLIGTVGKDGTLQQIQIVSGPALLVQSAVEAVRQWVYQPTMLNGKPVEVSAPIDVTFRISE
jgi:periplasmic protein TonB